MPRKKSASGRARGTSPENALLLKIEKANARFRSLEKGGNFNTYASKELVRFAQANPYLSVKTSKTRSKGGKSRRGRQPQRRHTLVITKGNIPVAQQRLINKKLNEALNSKVFSNIGIERVRKETRRKVKETLELESGEKLTEKDVDLFYDIAKYKYDDIIEKIGPSEFYQLVQVANKQNYNVEQWVELLKNYVEINNDVMRKQAEYLYNKFVQ